MAIEIGSSASLQFALDARQTLGSVAASAGTGPLRAADEDLPGNLRASRSRGPVVLDINKGTTAVATALVASAGVLSALRALESGLRTALNDGLTSPITNHLSADGSRVSRVNITSQAQRVTKAIDKLVDSAAVGSANLISSTSRRISIQTTRFGGSVTVSPQPLDSAGLGIAELSALTHDEAELALAKVGNAIIIAERRIDNLNALQDGLGFGTPTSQLFLQLVNSGPSSFLPPGSLVNQVA